MPSEDGVVAVKRLLQEGKIILAQSKLNTLEHVSEVLLIKSELANSRGNFNAQYYYAAKVLSNENADFPAIIESHYWMAEAKLKQGNFVIAENISLAGLELLSLFDSTKDDKFIRLKALLTFTMGKIQLETGRLNQAQIQFQSSLYLAKIIDDYLIIASNINKTAEIFSKRGRLKRANELFKAAYQIFMEHKKKSGQSSALLNIGQISASQGELDKALDYFMQSLELGQILGDNYRIASAMGKIAEIYFEKGEFDLSLIYLNISIQHWELIGHPVFLSADLLMKGKILLIQNKRDELFDIIKYLEKTKDREELSVISMGYNLLIGLVKKQSSRFKDKAKAIEIFHSITENEILDYNLTHEALVNYCDLLIQEVRLSDDQTIMEEVKETVNKLINLARSEHAYGKVIDTLLLKSKITSVNMEFENSLELIMEANMLAKQKELSGYTKRTQQELEDFHKNFHNMQEIVSDSSSIFKRINQLGIEDYLNEIMKVI
ncbi:MAG: tetratricopeptide repeat protein [Candidatus Kariarchaeaceae archaeon]|jgi:tetratricopeptide (TPR) repeat protein